MNDLERNPTRPIENRGSDTPAVRVVDVRKKYGDVVALDGVTLTIPAGKIVTMVGPNGAGKTSLTECLIGLRKPDSGSIEVLGVDVLRDPRRNFERLGILLQDARLFPRITVAECIDLFAALYEKTVDLAALKTRMGLDAYADRRLINLSGGWAQRLKLALAMINDPDLVVLDEPTVGLDPIARRELWDVIRSLKEQRKTVLMTTHYMDEAQELSDSIFMVSAGRIIAQGSAKEIITSTDGACANLDDAYAYLVKRSLQGVSDARS